MFESVILIQGLEFETISPLKCVDIKFDYSKFFSFRDFEV
jgi:hypothetical protein